MEDYLEEQQKCSKPSRTYRPFLLVVLFFSLYLTYLILRPFTHVLILAIVLSSLFHPLQEILVRFYKGKKNLAAVTIVFIITFVIAIPVFFFISALVTQGIDSINKLNDWIRTGNLQKLIDDPRIATYADWLQDRLSFARINTQDIPAYLLQLSRNLGQFLISRLAALLGDAASLVTSFFIMIFVVFYLVRDGKQMVEQGRYYSPLREDQEDRILDGVRVVARSVLMGTFLTSLLQGLVGGIGLWIVGVPALFWGTMMGFASLIPIIGTSIVWLPTAIYLGLVVSWKSAAFLAAWCIILVGSIDNFVRPFLMRGEGKMSPFYIFLAIIGGVQYFGLVGILYGPLILSFAMIMLYIYGVEYKHDLLAGREHAPVLKDPR